VRRYLRNESRSTERRRYCRRSVCERRFVIVAPLVGSIIMIKPSSVHNAGKRGEVIEHVDGNVVVEFEHGRHSQPVSDCMVLSVNQFISRRDRQRWNGNSSAIRERLWT
jgi:hypothetical protein